MEKIDKMNKKGVIGLADAAPVTILLLTIGIILTVGLLILAELDSEVISLAGSISQSITNETHNTIVDNTAIEVDRFTVDQLQRSLGDVIVTNSSDGVLVPSANFTVGSADATVTPLAGTAASFPDINITYAIGEVARTSAVNATIESQQGIETIASFQSIFGIVVAAAIVLGLIVLFR